MPAPSGSVLATKQRLIKVATELFQQQGFYATGLNTLLQQAKCPKGSLYHHFPGGKTDLAIACLEQLSQQLLEFIDQLALTQGTAGLIKALFQQTELWLKQQGWLGGSLLSTLNHETTAADTEIRQALKKAYDLIEAKLQQVFIAEGMAKNTAKDFSLQLMINYEGALNLASATQNKAPLQHAKNTLLQAYKQL